MQAPASVNLKAKGVHSLAVTTFEGPGDSGRKVAELLTARLVESQYFKVVEREKLLALEQEQVLAMTGVVDEKQAAKAGKVLGVDALVLGKVMPHLGQGKLALAYRVVKTETGEILMARQVMGGNSEEGRGMRRAFRKNEGEWPELMAKPAQHAVAKAVASLQPHPVKVDRGFENGGWLFGDADVKQGIEYIKANRPEDAIAQWEGIVARDPMNSAAWYDLGIAYEIMSEFDKAERAYRAAERITPKPRYTEAVGHVKAAAEAHRKLEAEQ
nr:tetratricopeptide repeat protein [Nitrospirota bacterium]